MVIGSIQIIIIYYLFRLLAVLTIIKDKIIEFIIDKVLYNCWCLYKKNGGLLNPMFIDDEEEEKIEIIYAGIVKKLPGADSSVENKYKFKLGKTKKKYYDITNEVGYVFMLNGANLIKVKELIYSKLDVNDDIMYIYYRKDSETQIYKIKLDLKENKYCYGGGEFIMYDTVIFNKKKSIEYKNR